MVLKPEAPFLFLLDSITLTHPIFSSACFIFILLSLHISKRWENNVAVFWENGYFI